MSFDPAAAATLLLAAALYLRAVGVLRARGYIVPPLQQAAWYTGLALLAAGLLGPLDHYADDLLVSHMAQHIVLADLSAPLLLIGLRTPVIQFILPRPALVAVARRRRLRSFLRTLRRPLVALPLATAVLFGWHIAGAFEAALQDPALHALQHQSFLAANLLVWWAAIEPKRRRMPGELWKAGYLLASRMPGMFLGMALVLARDPFYDGFYSGRESGYGLTILEDQQLAGGLMMTVDIVLMVIALTVFFWRAAADADRAEEAAARREAAAAGGAAAT